jgi:hypothetical protein
LLLLFFLKELEYELHLKNGEYYESTSLLLPSSGDRIFVGESKENVIICVGLLSDSCLFLIDGARSLTVIKITFKLSYSSSTSFLIDFSSTGLLHLESVVIIPKELNIVASFGESLIYLRSGTYELIEIQFESMYYYFI